MKVSQAESHEIVIFALLAVFFLFLPDARGTETLHGPLDIACGTCHSDENTTVPYSESVFDHSKTGFPLIGQHLAVSCIECHKELVFRGTPQQCASCHDDIHNDELGADCARCHTTQSFTIVDDVTGFHDSTRFPLRGAHRTVPCIDCHTDSNANVWRGLDTECISCHLADYNVTTTPDHQSAGIPYDCAMCHNEQPGFRMVFDHDRTGYDLTGAHIILECIECHRGSFFQSIPEDCVACHLADYNLTTTPDHSAAGYSLVCEDCHVTTAWIPATIGLQHDTYPLTGAHLSADCASCHPNGEYFGTPRDCAACHGDEYAGAADPDHKDLQFPQTCEDCHSPIAWIPSNFNHSVTAFPLTGAHSNLACDTCHTTATGLYPPNDCYSCHEDEYDEAPDHTTQSYPTDCSDCHISAAWVPSSFIHDAFPVYSGNHSHRWTSCADCHPIPGDFHAITCFTCHSPTIHGRSYTSEECYQCHPDGRE